MFGDAEIIGRINMNKVEIRVTESETLLGFVSYGLHLSSYANKINIYK